jgi:SPP1 family predicted phage head-tail adaptor
MVTGELRERVTFQSKTPTSDNRGGRAQAWSTAIADVAARVDVDPDTEAIQAEQLTTTSRYRVTVRYRSSITSRMRVLWRGLTLQITSVRNADPRREWLELHCAMEQA